MPSAVVIGPLEAVAVAADALDDVRVTALTAGMVEVLAAGDVAMAYSITRTYRARPGLQRRAAPGGAQQPRRIVQCELDETLAEPVAVIQMSGESESDGFAFDDNQNVVITCTHPPKGRGECKYGTCKETSYRLPARWMALF